jgi:hypothetical protein
MIKLDDTNYWAHAQSGINYAKKVDTDHRGVYDTN